MKRALVLVVTALAVAGCGDHERRFGELRVTATAEATVRPAARPRVHGPGPLVIDVAFLSRRVGVAVTFHYQGVPAARIQRTVDGGDTWRDVVVGRRRMSFAWIARGPSRRFFAGGFDAEGRPVLYVSADAGATWTARRPRLFPTDWESLHPTFVSRTFAFTVPDTTGYAAGPFATTRDGGRNWQPLRVPKGTAGIQFVDSRHAYAAAGPDGSRCDGSLWRTHDGGSTWTRIMCGDVPLAAVQFLDGRRGFAAGGWPAARTEQAPSAVVYATDDGGATWHRRYSDPRTGHGLHPIVDLRFVDAQRGWARTGQCKSERLPEPCVGTVLVTRDGGRTWARQGDALRLSTIGARDAWAVKLCDGGCNAIYRTRNAGRTWRPLARSDGLSIGVVAASGGLLSIGTEIGRLVSIDGRRWRFADPNVTAARPGFSVDGSYSSNSEIVALADESHAYALPYGRYACEMGSIRTLRVTADRGRTWRVKRLPFNASSIAADGRQVAIVGWRGKCSNILATSDDRGRTWEIRRLPRKRCSVALARADLVLGCGRKLLFSRDGGRTWALVVTPKRVDTTHIAALGRGVAWTTFYDRHASHLVRSTDGGRTWVEQWPRLPTP